MEVAKTHQSQLDRIKSTIRNTHEYYYKNYKAFNDDVKFTYDTTLCADEIALLMSLNMPQLEFNIIRPLIFRILGEISENAPDIIVSADDQNIADPMTIKIVEQHLRHDFSSPRMDRVKNELADDILSGGMGVLKVITEYANPNSFDQIITIKRANPVLCGFDINAQEPHKGDGRYCFEVFPMIKEDFIRDYPQVPIDQLSFSRNIAGFNWSYSTDKNDILLVVHYYEKKKKSTKIVKLSDGKTITLKQYEKMLENWNEFSQPPEIVNKRTTDLETICRYTLIENKVLEYIETDFTMLPLVFASGVNKRVSDPNNANVKEVYPSFISNLRDNQKLKNFTGISMANGIESTVQSKFIIKKEALPKEEDFLEAIKNHQRASNIVVNAFSEEDPNIPIPDPIREVMKVPTPPEVYQSFVECDSTLQKLTGSYDSALGINNNQLSGRAIMEGGLSSNKAVKPYITGLMDGLTRTAEIYIDLIPKYYTTPRTIPLMNEEGKRSSLKINENGHNMFYDANTLNVVVKAGASFQVQKSHTLMMIKEVMGMSPLFAQFMGEKGINFILDNMEGRGIDQLKSMVDEWLKELAAQKQSAMEQQKNEANNNPLIMKNQIEMAKLQQQAQKAQSDFIVDMQKLKQDEAKILADLQQSKESNTVQMVKAETERFSKKVDLALKHKDMNHRHTKEAIELHHNIKKDREGQNKKNDNQSH